MKSTEGIKRRITHDKAAFKKSLRFKKEIDYAKLYTTRNQEKLFKTACIDCGYMYDFKTRNVVEIDKSRIESSEMWY